MYIYLNQYKQTTDVKLLKLQRNGEIIQLYANKLLIANRIIHIG